MQKAFGRSLAVLLLFTGLSFAQAPAAAPAHDMAKSAAEPADKIWGDLLAGNRRFIAGQTQRSAVPALRAKLATGQQPKVMVLGCSDSRVPPEEVFDQNLGDLFVVRSAGNIADAIGVGSMEYAFEHLGSTVLVVMGHTKCGAVSAACSGEKMPTSNLQAIVDKIGPAVLLAKGRGDTDDKLVSDAITENALRSAQDLTAHSEVLRHAVNDGKLTIIPVLYHLDTGEVTRLDAKK